MARHRPLVVTAGEPAGVGPELCNALVGTRFEDDIVVIGDRRHLDDRLPIIDMPFPAAVDPGAPTTANAGTLLDGLRHAAQGCLDGKFSGMVTAPIAKSVIADSGVAFTGHTEFLAEITGAELPVMMLVAGELRVALATTHLPLRDVPDAVTPQRLESTLRVLNADLRRFFGITDPDIVVCGLNPHAGEEGHLGREDIDVIAPTLERLRAEGLNLRGPLPADTAFTPACGHSDAVLAMYHDQGLPVLKYACLLYTSDAADDN